MKQVILIIDNDGDTLDILGYLVKESDIEVVLKSNVIPLAEIRQINPDLIILDEWIGGYKGSELCLEIKQSPDTKDIPVVMISALPSIGKIAMECNADGSISKPFDIDEIQEVIAAYLS